MYRLIYKSTSRTPPSWANLADILTKSTSHNDRAGLTGVLLANRAHFLQVLEGAFEDVNETFTRIVRDDRHAALRILSYGVVEERLFSEWQMLGVGVFDLDPDVTRALIDQYGEEDGDVRFPEQEWLALALIRDLRRLRDLPEWTGEGDPPSR